MGFCDSSELLRAGITFTSRRSRRPWPAPSRRRVRQCGGEEELRLDKTRGNGTSTAQEVHEISRRRSSRGRVPLLKSDMQNANEKEPYELPFPSASGPLCASFKLIMLSSHAAYGLRSRRAGEFCRPFPFYPSSSVAVELHITAARRVDPCKPCDIVPYLLPTAARKPKQRFVPRNNAAPRSFITKEQMFELGSNTHTRQAHRWGVPTYVCLKLRCVLFSLLQIHRSVCAAPRGPRDPRCH